MMIQTAWFRVIIPELTKPTTMTVVAEEDWITAGDARAHQDAQKTVGSQPLQDQLHLAAGSGLQAGAHHLHAVQEQRETAQKTQKA